MIGQQPTGNKWAAHIFSSSKWCSEFWQAGADQNIEQRLERKTTSMKDDLNGRRPQWNMTSMEDNLNGRRPQWRWPQCKKSLMEDDLNGGWPPWNTTSMEDILNGEWPQWKTTSMGDNLGGRWALKDDDIVLPSNPILFWAWHSSSPACSSAWWLYYVKTI